MGESKVHGRQEFWLGRGKTGEGLRVAEDIDVAAGVAGLVVSMVCR